MAHRAGWDATFSAPKSVSLTALVGGDDRVRDAHRASVRVALDEMERYVQARLGRNHPAETTGQWVAATFEHDSARPVDGYAAPQLHTHVVFFNLTERANGEHPRAAAARALQDAALRHGRVPLRARHAPDRAGLRDRARRQRPARDPRLHAGVSRGLESAPPADRGPPRSSASQRGAAAAQIAAHHTREAKQRHRARGDAAPASGAGGGPRPSADAVVQAARERARAARAARAADHRARGRHVCEGPQLRARGGRRRARAAAGCARRGRWAR